MILDTNALVWITNDDRRLGSHARQVIERAWQLGQVGVSTITFWEVAMLLEKGRIHLPEDPIAWRYMLLEQGLVEFPIDGEIAIRAGLLRDMHGDPADRIIVATAQNGHELVTSDRRILDWDGDLRTIDARE